MSDMHHKRFVSFLIRHNTKKFWLIFAAVVAVLGIAAIIYFVWFSKQPLNRADPKGSGTAAEPSIKIVPSPLSGEEVSSDLAKRPITGVIIENSPNARPQSGLASAGVIFEAIAEGGITRLLVLYQEGQPELIGPVRSIRPYYVDWSMGYEASVAHVGGSAEGLQQIRTLPGARDLDQFANGAYFFRSTDRYAPHNVYTRTSLLDELSDKRGYKSSKFEPVPRKKPTPSEAPNAQNIAVNFSSNLFRANYTYNPAENNYLRSIGGVPHLDRESGQQLKSTVIVVMKTSFSLHPDGQHYVYGTIGSGEALVFQDGTVTIGTWEKASRTDMIKLKNAEGQPIKLNPGQTWYEALPSNKTVTYE